MLTNLPTQIDDDALSLRDIKKLTVNYHGLFISEY